MNTLIRRLVILAFLGTLVGLFAYFNLTRPRILVLQSYQTNYAWTRDLDAGLNRVLHRHPNYAIRWHYMDTKAHPWPEFLRAAGTTARSVIAEYQPDVLIAVDDDAQKLAARHFANDRHINIVFAGVNGEVAQYGYDGADNVTGIYERKPLGAVRDLIVQLAERAGIAAPRVVHIGDTSGSVRLDDQDMAALDWAPVRFLGSRLAATWGDWQVAVEEAQTAADFILVSNYRKLARSATDPALLPFEQVMPWTEAHSRILVIGTNGFNVEDGAGLAIGTSPYEQGEVAAGMAVAIIQQRQSAATIPRARTQQFTVSIREERLLAKHQHLPAVYEAFARATDSFIPVSAELRLALTATEPPAAPPKPPAPSPKPTQPTVAAVECPTPAIAAPLGPELPRTAALEFTATGRATVRVTAADGRRLLNAKLAKGKPRTLEAPLPLRLRLTSQKAVSVNIAAPERAKD